MNVYDSGRMADVLKPFGFVASNDVDDADMVILNTCHIREKAAEKVYSELGRMRDLKVEKKSNGSDMLIAVAGCVAQAEGEEIFRRAPYVDIVVGPQSYQTLPELITKIARGGKMQINLDFPAISKFDSLPEEAQPCGISSFLSIQEGCDEFCKYCVVPYTRGAEYSRNLAETYREALRLVTGGAKEITLLGQNVNAYNGLDIDGNQLNLGKLIMHLAKINGLRRIRYTTSHPRSMHEDLVKAHAEVPQLMPFLHLPLQSGSDRILKAMNRKHTIKDYMHYIDRLKQVRPDMGFSSDFIIGYPGESDQDFRDTLKIIEQIEFAQCYSFTYSPRPGTPAAMEPQLDENLKSERLAEAQALIASYQTKYNNSFLGKNLQVLLEKTGKHQNQLVGKSQYMQSVHLKAPGELIGQIVTVKIDKIMSNSLTGSLANNE